LNFSRFDPKKFNCWVKGGDEPLFIGQLKNFKQHPQNFQVVTTNFQLPTLWQPKVGDQNFLVAHFDDKRIR